MDERRAGDAAVTGVAKGALGTGTALEETQEWVIPEGLQSSTATPAPAPEPAISAPAAAAAAAPNQPMDLEPVTRRRASGTVTRRPAPATTPSGARFSPGPRTAGIAAAILLALVGVAAVVTTLDRDDAGAATPAEVPSAAPTQAPAAGDDGDAEGDDDGEGGGGNNGGGNGNGNGNGNGGGNGGGNGNGNGDGDD